jgi:hypothetical protein
LRLAVLFSRQPCPEAGVGLALFHPLITVGLGIKIFYVQMCQIYL